MKSKEQIEERIVELQKEYDWLVKHDEYVQYANNLGGQMAQLKWVLRED